jgi:hypothetical protein
MDMFSKNVEVNGQKIELEIWTTMDLEQLGRAHNAFLLRPLHRLNAYIFVYERSCVQSFKSIKLIDKFSFIRNKVPKLLIGYEAFDSPREITT